MSNIAQNKQFLSNLYHRGPFKRHGFMVTPPLKGISEDEGGDPTVHLDRDLSFYVDRVEQNFLSCSDWQAQLQDDAVPVAKLLTGTQIFGHAFGCAVHTFAKDSPCALPLVQEAEEAESIQEPRLEDCPNLLRWFDFADAVQQRLGRDVPIGPPDSQTGFDVVCLIWEKSSLYCALIDEEEREAVHRLHSKVLRLMEAFWDEVRKRYPQMCPNHCPGSWSPPELGIWFSNDESGAVSQDVYREFILPELNGWSQRYGSIGMHCCANAEHQFPLLMETPDFYAFNRVAAQKGWLSILNEMAGPDGPVHNIAWIKEHDMQELISRAPKGTRFIFEQKELTSVDEGKAWLERAHAMS